MDTAQQADLRTAVIRRVGESGQRNAFGQHALHVVADLGQASVVRVTHQPGWHWSEHNRAAGAPEWCERTHVGYVLSGREHIRLRDGSDLEVGPDDAYLIPPGHDAWVVGDEPYQGVDFVMPG